MSMSSEECIVFSCETHWLSFNRIILMRDCTFLLVSIWPNIARVYFPATYLPTLKRSLNSYVHINSRSRKCSWLHRWL